jgi:glycerophosphoryl diester phosphodiesterase
MPNGFDFPILPPDQRPDFDHLPGLPASRVSDRRPIIVGHRGARGLAPENTLAGFQAAVEVGVDGIEFDVQRSQDGHLVVFHDDDVERVTGSSGAIASMTLDAIQALDAGRNFAPQYAGERIPTLRETFAALQASDVLLFVELKSPWRFPGIEGDLAALMREFGLVDRCQVRSFYHPSLHTLYRLAPEIPLSELWWDHLPTDDEVVLKTVNALHLLFTPETVAQLHARGQQATAWTVNNLDAARRLCEAGIDGLTTDFPHRLLDELCL